MNNVETIIWSKLDALLFVYQTRTIYCIEKKQIPHDDVIQWKYFLRCWPLARGIHRWRVDSPPEGQRRGPLMFSLTRAWINGCVNNRGAGDRRRHRDHYDGYVMLGQQLVKHGYEQNDDMKPHDHAFPITWNVIKRINAHMTSPECEWFPALLSYLWAA